MKHGSYWINILSVDEAISFLYSSKQEYSDAEIAERNKIEKYLSLLIKQDIDMTVLPEVMHKFFKHRTGGTKDSKYINQSIHDLILERYMTNQLRGYD